MGGFYTLTQALLWRVVRHLSMEVSAGIQLRDL